MALNIKNPEVERLATELAQLTHESKTETIRRALEERKLRLISGQSKEQRLQTALQFLHREVYSKLPPEMLGKKITKREREEALGYGPDGLPE